MLAASRLVGGPIDLASDSQYVVKACARIVGGAEVREWEHADLWERIAPDVRSGRIVARWVPAHKSVSEARRLGLAERDRLGNAAADSHAGEAARRRLPPRALVRDRVAVLAQLEAAQRVMAAAHLAAVKASAALRGEPAQRQRRDWSRIRRGARPRASSLLPPLGQSLAGPLDMGAESLDREPAERSRRTALSRRVAWTSRHFSQARRSAHTQRRKVLAA